MLHWQCVTQLEQVAVRVQHIVVIRDITAQHCLLPVGVHAVLQMQRVQVVIIQRSYAIRDIIKMVLNVRNVRHLAQHLAMAQQQ